MVLNKHMIKEFEQDPDLHCAVLHGLGGNFCAGYDLEVCIGGLIHISTDIKLKASMKFSLSGT